MSSIRPALSIDGTADTKDTEADSQGEQSESSPESQPAQEPQPDQAPPPPQTEPEQTSTPPPSSDSSSGPQEPVAASADAKVSTSATITAGHFVKAGFPAEMAAKLMTALKKAVAFAEKEAQAVEERAHYIVSTIGVEEFWAAKMLFKKTPVKVYASTLTDELRKDLEHERATLSVKFVPGSK